MEELSQLRPGLQLKDNAIETEAFPYGNAKFVVIWNLNFFSHCFTFALLRQKKCK